MLGSFSKYINEMEVTEIPIKYIKQIDVFYISGKRVVLDNEDVQLLYGTDKIQNWKPTITSKDGIREIKVNVDLLALEKDINATLDDLTRPN